MSNAKAQLRLFRQAVQAPDKYNGNRTKWTTWWMAMQCYLMGLDGLSNAQKIIITLTKLQKGNAMLWAKSKRLKAGAGKLKSWSMFEAELTARFSDPIHPQKALNQIHNFTQGKMSITMYLDCFEILKNISMIGKAKALYLVCRGLNPCILSVMYASHEDPLTMYAAVTTQARKISKNLDVSQGLRASNDRQMGSGVIFGGTGRAMDTTTGATQV